MAGAGGLLIVLLGVALGLLSAPLGAVALLLSPIARAPRVGRVLAWFAIAFDVVAMVLSLPVWIVLLSRTSTHGEHLGRHDLGWFFAIVGYQLVGLSVSVVALRRCMRTLRHASTPATPGASTG